MTGKHHGRSWPILGWAAAALWLGAALAPAALAQSSSSTYRADLQPQLDGREKATGLRVGSFLLRPELSIKNEYTDNYLLEENAPASSFILRVAPSASLTSTWSRHTLRLNVGAEQGVYSASFDDNYLDYFADAGAEIDVSRSMRIYTEGGFERLHEGRGVDESVSTLPATAGELLSTTPVEYSVLSARSQIDYKPNRVRVSPWAEYLRFDFDDTATSNEDDRDRDEFRIGGAIGYEFSEGYEMFVDASMLDIAYVADLDDAGLNRDSQGYEARGGVNFRITRLLNGSIGAGYYVRDYTDDTLESLDGVAVDGSIEWTPTEATKIALIGRRGLNETTLADVAGTTQTFGRVEVDHAFRPNVVVTAFAAAANEVFESDGADREDDTYQFGLGAEWLIHRSLSAEALYSYENEISTADGASFDANAFYIGFSARY